MMLPLVVRFNGADAGTQHAYADLASAPEIACASEGHEQAWLALIARLEALLNLAGLPRSLADCDVKRELIPQMAEEAAKQWTANFNPRKITARDFAKLYEAAFDPRGAGDAL
jgi:alcohol dehydrogenase